MEIKVSTGEWVPHILSKLTSASDGDYFILPSTAHLHAYEIAKKSTTSSKNIKVIVQ